MGEKARGTLDKDKKEWKADEMRERQIALGEPLKGARQDDGARRRARREARARNRLRARWVQNGHSSASTPLILLFSLAIFIYVLPWH